MHSRSCEADLEQIRHRMLIKEFPRYQQLKVKLKLVRTEALGAGFKEAWQKGEYAAIIQTTAGAEAVIQEESGLLMYYDNALIEEG